MYGMVDEALAQQQNHDRLRAAANERLVRLAVQADAEGRPRPDWRAALASMLRRLSTPLAVGVHRLVRSGRSRIAPGI